MKNLIKLQTVEEIDEFVQDLWRTDIFRESHVKDGGYINQLVKEFARYPRVFFEMTDPDIEWSHFTTWMNAYALRPDYDMDAIHDLYYLHEFWHGATMTYPEGISFTKWHRKMCENEMQASVHSEALAYFALEGLRDLSFDFEIWVDRFLDKEFLSPSLSDFIPGNDPLDRNFEYLYEARKEVMRSPDPFDYVEMQIHYYAMQNVQWSNIWSDRFREVEHHMRIFQETAKENREDALQLHIEWLNNKRAPLTFNGKAIGRGKITPYEREAYAFAKIVKENKARQGNQILEK